MKYFLIAFLWSGIISDRGQQSNTPLEFGAVHLLWKDSMNPDSNKSYFLLTPDADSSHYSNVHWIVAPRLEGMKADSTPFHFDKFVRLEKACLDQIITSLHNLPTVMRTGGLEGEYLTVQVYGTGIRAKRLIDQRSYALQTILDNASVEEQNCGLGRVLQSK